MESVFSNRIQQVPRSFIRDILKAASSPSVISFAGGLPNKKYFPVNKLAESTQRVLRNHASSALQYSLTNGLSELRELIAGFYINQGVEIPIENILITTGSQQALDLIGKTFINEGDKVILEEPSYLGAIQAFSMYNPFFDTIKLEHDGINIKKWQKSIDKRKAKFSYIVTNFQNPSGATYSISKREQIAEYAKKTNSVIVEDDPYGRITFLNEQLPNIYKFAPNNTLLLGSFSKSIVPGFRLGWIVANKKFIKKLEIAKQASDLHTDVFAQHIVIDFLKNNNIQNHLNKIINAYKNQANVMNQSIDKYFPNECKYSKPQGGMFTWVELPEYISSLELFKKAKEKNVAFVPGVPFYIGKTDCSTMRLNFSCSEPNVIIEGIKRLANVVKQI